MRIILICIQVRFNTLVYLISIGISTILFFYVNVYGGLNVKKNLQRFHAFWPISLFLQ